MPQVSLTSGAVLFLLAGSAGWGSTVVRGIASRNLNSLLLGIGAQGEPAQCKDEGVTRL